MTISIRASSLQTYESCPRRFVAEWLRDNQLDQEYGFMFEYRQPYIGTIFGSAVHAGVAKLWDTNSVKAAELEAIDYINNAMDDRKVIMDNITKGSSAAMVGASSIIHKYAATMDPDDVPLIVEGELKASFVEPHWGLDYVITGTLDTFMHSRKLKDLKTGKSKPAPFAQMGCYLDLLGANGHEVTSAQADFYKRVRSVETQPDVEVIPIDMDAAVTHSRTLHKAAVKDIHQVLDTGSPDAVIPRPKDNFLCSKRSCPAWGTDFCSIGAIVNPGRSV